MAKLVTLKNRKTIFENVSSYHSVVLEHEDCMLNKYQSILKDYINEFKPIGLDVDIRLIWSKEDPDDNFIRKLTQDRPRIEYGYRCDVLCRVYETSSKAPAISRNDEIVGLWCVTYVSKFLFEERINLFDDVSDAYKDLDEFLYKLHKYSRAANE